MESRIVSGLRVYAPRSRRELIDFAFKEKGLLVAVNAEKILHATDQTRGIINRSIGYPDGIGAVLALKKKGVAGAAKIPGCELWLDILRDRFVSSTFYLVGGKAVVIDDVVKKLRAEFPGVRILGFRDGYIRNDSEKVALLNDIARLKPDVVFVAMGSPRQEVLMEELRRVHEAVYQGLGGSFDVYTGRVDRAPAWWIRNHLEWLYRLLREPARIGRQIHLVRFLWRLTIGRL